MGTFHENSAFKSALVIAVVSHLNYVNMASLQYINSKLSDAIHILTIHEGDACTRLAKVFHNLKRLSVSSFPEELQNEYKWIKDTLQRGNQINMPGVMPHKLTGIQNRTARKVIEKIVFIQNKINAMI